MAQTKRSHVCTIPLRVRFSCQGLPHNAILPHHQHPQQRKHRPDSPKRVCQKRDAECKNGNIFRFWRDAVLVLSRRSFPAAMLDSPLPTRRQGDIRLPSQAASDRNLRSVSRSRAVRFCCSGWFASWPGSQDGQRMSQTDFSDSLQPAGHCDRVSPNPDNAHAVVL